MVKAISSWAVSLLRYSGGVVKWTKLQLMNLDRKTRKLLTIHGALHPRGLISVEDCVNLEQLSLVDYLSQSEERLLKAAWRRRNRSEVEHPDGHKRREHEERVKDWSEKELHGQYIRQTKEVAGSESWNWLKVGDRKKETGGLITAAQDQALRTNGLRQISNIRVCQHCAECVENARRM